MSQSVLLVWLAVAIILGDAMFSVNTEEHDRDRRRLLPQTLAGLHASTVLRDWSGSLELTL